MLVDGPFWATQRRFTLAHMREFGFGKTNMESLIDHEVQSMLADMKQKLEDSGRVFHFKNYFNIPLINTLWWILAGARFEPTDLRLRTLIELFDSVGRSGDIVSVAFPCPMILMKLFTSLFPKMGRMDLLGQVRTFIEVSFEYIEEKKRGIYLIIRNFERLGNDRGS